MSETKQCKYCKEEIAYDAKICPNCRKKQKSKKRMVFVIVLIIIIVGAVKVLVARVTVSAEASAEISTSFSTSRPLPLYEGCKTSSWQLANPRNRQSMNMYRIAFLISSYSFQ